MFQLQTVTVARVKSNVGRGILNTYVQIISIYYLFQNNECAWRIWQFFFIFVVQVDQVVLCLDGSDSKMTTPHTVCNLNLVCFYMISTKLIANHTQPLRPRRHLINCMTHTERPRKTKTLSWPYSMPASAIDMITKDYNVDSAFINNVRRLRFHITILVIIRCINAAWPDVVFVQIVDEQYI